MLRGYLNSEWNKERDNTKSLHLARRDGNLKRDYIVLPSKKQKVIDCSKAFKRKYMLPF